MVRPPYPVVVRLYYIAGRHWPYLDAAYPGVDLVRLPCNRFLNYVYVWLMERTKEEDRERVDYELNKPIPGMELNSPSAAAAEDEALAAMMSMQSQIEGR